METTADPATASSGAAAPKSFWARLGDNFDVAALAVGAIAFAAGMSTTPA